MPRPQLKSYASPSIGGYLIQVQKALEADGFFPGSIAADGKIHRFKRDRDDKGECGWYLCHQNHSDRGEVFYVCVWGDWREQGAERKFVSSFTQTKFDRKKIEEQLEKAERARRAEQERVWMQASEKANAKWTGDLLDGGESDYCNRKKLSGLFGARSQLDPASGTRALYLPVRDLDGKIWGLQKILPDGNKRFSAGTKKHGNFHIVGASATQPASDALKNEEIIYLAEGFATAASIHMATGKPCVCCFDAGNLSPVAKILRAKFKEARFVICGDDDRFADTGNAGRDKAEAAAKEVLGKAVFPVFRSTESRPTDFNDLHCLDDLDAVRGQILGVNPEIHRIFTLGHLGDTYFYISSSNQQITAMTVSSHTQNALINLMPLPYWESQYPSKKGVDWTVAINDLMQACRKAGVFQPEKIRGVGVWPEKDGCVVNLGNSVWVNGRTQQLNSFPSQYTYEIASKIMPPHESPMTSDECVKLVAAIEMLKWKRQDFAKFFAGWIVVAPLAGALQWRPHVWLNGPTGSGKSWIMQTVVNRMFGNNRFYFQGNTTEAGIRQTVGSNARPVIFDEFETDDQKSNERVKSILELIRQASSESDGMVVKGGSSGHSVQYRIRFACMVASVRVNLIHEQDKTRFTLLDLERGDPGQFPKIEAAFREINDDYAARLFSRSVRMMPAILENQKRFQAVLSEKYNSRFGQQYGTLLAGYGALLSNEPLPYEEVEGIVAALNLNEESEVTQERDEVDCLDYLLKKVVKVDTITWGGNCERSIAELIQQAQCDEREQPTINRMGIRADKDVIYIANAHPYLSKIFENTKWVGGWRKPLLRLPGAQIAGLKRFGATPAKCVSVPFCTAFPR